MTPKWKLFAVTEAVVRQIAVRVTVVAGEIEDVRKKSQCVLVKSELLGTLAMNDLLVKREAHGKSVRLEKLAQLATNVDPVKIVRHGKIVLREKTAVHAKSVHHEKRRLQTDLLAVRRRGIVMQSKQVNRLGIDVILGHHVSLRNSKISRPGKKPSELCRCELQRKTTLVARKTVVAEVATAAAVHRDVGRRLQLRLICSGMPQRSDLR